MKMFRVLGLVLLLSSAASAAVITYSDAVNPNPSLTDWTDQLLLPQFDSSLGTLTEAKITFAGMLDDCFGAENTGPNAGTLYYKYINDQALAVTGTNLPSFTMNATRGGTALKNFGTVTAFDGVLDYAGTSGSKIQYGVLTDGASYAYTTDLTKFIGTGNLVYDAVATSLFSMTLYGGNSSGKSYSAAGITVTADYTYTPVPEPATLAVLGLGGLLLRRRLA